MSSALIFDVDRFSTHDGPGVRMAVFFKGCPLSCAWCHSPESRCAAPEAIYQATKCTHCGLCVDDTGVCGAMPNPGEYLRDKCVLCFRCAKNCPTRALAVCGRHMEVDEILDIARRDADYYAHSGGGVTLTGGEVLMQAGAAIAILDGLNAMSIHAAIETSGFGSRDALNAIAHRADLIYYDIKHMDSDAHKRYTGVDTAVIHDNLRTIAREHAAKIIIRVPIIPNINDSHKNIQRTAYFAHALNIEHIELLPYNHMAQDKYAWVFREYPLIGTEPLSVKRMDELNRLIAGL